MGLSSVAIRQFQHEKPEAFVREGLRVLLDADGSADHRFLAILLVNTPAVFEALTDRWLFTRAEAIAVSNRLQQVSPNFEKRLMERLPEGRVGGREFVLAGEAAERALEILDEICPGSKIAVTLRNLTNHPDRRISSKAVLMAGKRAPDVAWAQHVIKEAEDPRLRANALETLWGMTSAEALELFRSCLTDKGNRVVGNAVIGLHKAGDPEILEVVSRLAGDTQPQHRMTAAWAMGELGDQSFASLLAGLAKDGDAAVRRAALRSLRSLRLKGRQTEAAVEAIAAG